jgi:NADH-quinone oxidoreductase subunit C
VVQRPKKRESAAPQAPVALDDRGLALSTLLGSALDDVDVQIDAAVDEVVVVLSPDDLLAVCRIARESDDLDFNYLRCVSVVDYEERLEVNYHLFSLAKRHKMVIKTSVSPEAPNVPTVTGVWRAADWFEREGHDLFGVVFIGHPDLAPLLLYEGFEGFPGRKSFPFHDYDEW